MRNIFPIKRHYAYIILAALYTLWQISAGWLNTWWTQLRLGDGFTTINFVLFFTTHAAGTAYFAWRLDKPITVQRLKRLALFSALFTALFTALMAFAGGLWLILAGMLSGFAAGFFTAFLCLYMFLHIPSENRGVVLGFSAGAGLAVHYVLLTLLFPQTTIVFLYGKTFFAAGVFLLLGVLSLALPLCRDSLWNENRAFYSEPRESVIFQPRMMPLLALILIFFFISYGIQDFAATAYWLSGSSFLGHTRIFLVLGSILGGVLWDRKYRGILLSFSFGFLALGFIAMACQYRGAASFIGFAGVQLASVFFSLSIRLVFLDIARFYKKPVFVASLGLVLPLILKQSGILSAGVIYVTLGGTVLFIVSLVCIALGIPFIALLFEKVRDMNVLDVHKHTPVVVTSEDSVERFELPEVSRPAREGAEEKADIIIDFTFAEVLLTLLLQKHSFTKREIQILELSLHDLSNSEMAQRMSISEATVKYHIRNILAKTGAKSLKQLFWAAAREKKWTETVEV